MAASRSIVRCIGRQKVWLRFLLGIQVKWCEFSSHSHPHNGSSIFFLSPPLSVAHLFKWFPWVWRMRFADERAQLHSFLHIVWFNFYYSYSNIHSDSLQCSSTLLDSALLSSAEDTCVCVCLCREWKTNLSVRVQNEKAQLKEYKFYACVYQNGMDKSIGIA